MKKQNQQKLQSLIYLLQNRIFTQECKDLLLNIFSSDLEDNAEMALTLAELELLTFYVAVGDFKPSGVYKFENYDLPSFFQGLNDCLGISEVLENFLVECFLTEEEATARFNSTF